MTVSVLASGSELALTYKLRQQPFVCSLVRVFNIGTDVRIRIHYIMCNTTESSSPAIGTDNWIDPTIYADLAVFTNLFQTVEHSAGKLIAYRPYLVTTTYMRYI